jgi:hypothetical protein
MEGRWKRLPICDYPEFTLKLGRSQIKAKLKQQQSSLCLAANATIQMKGIREALTTAHLKIVGIREIELREALATSEKQSSRVNKRERRIGARTARRRQRSTKIVSSLNRYLASGRPGSRICWSDQTTSDRPGFQTPRTRRPQTLFRRRRLAWLIEGVPPPPAETTQPYCLSQLGHSLAGSGSL